MEQEETTARPCGADANARWAADPERIDPDDYPPDQPFVKLMTWAPCPTCERQVHGPVALYLLQGIRCPACGTQLLPPPDGAGSTLSRILHQEDRLSGELYSDAH